MQKTDFLVQIFNNWALKINFSKALFRFQTLHYLQLCVTSDKMKLERDFSCFFKPGPPAFLFLLFCITDQNQATHHLNGQQASAYQQTFFSGQVNA